MTSKKDDWQEVTVEDAHIWDRSQPIEGELVEAKSNVGPNESMMYVIKTKDGNMSVWGSTVLDTKLEHVPTGVTVKIEPLGLTESPKTGRKYMDFKVFFKDLPFKEVGPEPDPEMPVDWLEDDAKKD